MRHSVQIVNSTLGVLGLIGLGMAIGATAVHLSVQNVKPEWDTWVLIGLGSLVALELVTIDRLARARARNEHAELYSQIRIVAEHLDFIGQGNRNHVERLAKSLLLTLVDRMADVTGALVALEERTHQLVASERAQVAEVIEQLHAVSTILEDWRERVPQIAAITDDEIAQGLANIDEPITLLDLAADALRAMAAEPETVKPVTKKPLRRVDG